MHGSWQKFADNGRGGHEDVMPHGQTTAAPDKVRYVITKVLCIQTPVRPRAAVLLQGRQRRGGEAGVSRS